MQVYRPYSKKTNAQMNRTAEKNDETCRAHAKKYLYTFCISIRENKQSFALNVRQ